MRFQYNSCFILQGGERGRIIMGFELRRCRGDKDFVLYGVSFMEQMDFSCTEGVRGLLVFIPPSNTLIRED